MGAWFGKKRSKKKQTDTAFITRGLLIFANTSEVIHAERVLKKAGWQIRVMGPPPEIRTGCDLVIEFSLIEELRIVRELEDHALSPLQVVPVTAPLLSPVSLFHHRDFDRYFMVRAANMKITIDKQNQEIVNISGGGCPDVPYLAKKMVGSKLCDAPDPAQYGHTLCGYALSLAYREILRLAPEIPVCPPLPEISKKTALKRKQRPFLPGKIAIIGTVPDPEFPLTHGVVELKDGTLLLNGYKLSVSRCTPALIAAALKAQEYLRSPEIHAFLVGDIGKGAGSRQLYQFLEQFLPENDFQVITFHYCQPDVDWHNRILFAIEKMAHPPLLIADAGFMYAAKMSGQAARYDFFTPDMGELAFLADELAPHPFYTRGFILQQDTDPSEHISAAYLHDNAARCLLVKGRTDYIVEQGKIVDSVKQPVSEAMEAIGGTGDTITGLLTVLCAAGYSRHRAAKIAAETNRWMGFYLQPTPATQVEELIAVLPQALQRAVEGELTTAP